MNSHLLSVLREVDLEGVVWIDDGQSVAGSQLPVMFVHSYQVFYKEDFESCRIYVAGGGKTDNRVSLVVLVNDAPRCEYTDEDRVLGEAYGNTLSGYLKHLSHNPNQITRMKLGFYEYHNVIYFAVIWRFIVSETLALNYTNFLQNATKKDKKR